MGKHRNRKDVIQKIDLFKPWPGQWLKFPTMGDLLFLVVSREDEVGDPCRCFLIDEKGKSYDYCPRNFTIKDLTARLGPIDFFGPAPGECRIPVTEKVTKFPDEAVLHDYKDTGTIERMADAAAKFIEEKSSYFKDFRVSALLNVKEKFEKMGIDILSSTEPDKPGF